MKILTIILTLLTVISTEASELKDERVIRKTMDVENPENFYLEIRNIQGDVIVKPSAGTTLELEVVITITAEKEEDLQRGIKEMSLLEVVKKTKAFYSVDAPFITHHWDGEKLRGFSSNSSNAGYIYKYDFVVKVPSEINLKAGTVDNGHITISDITGDIEAANVNGNIRIQGAQEVINANTINGKVDIIYGANPTKDGNFHSINGDITLGLQEGFNAQVQTKSMNGEFFSAFDFEYLQPSITVNTSKKGNGTTYKIGEKPSVQIGKAGPKLSFETLNGDVYLKRS
ncbi:MAG: hypothetical protein KI790_10780 [Cyclobacteriaceae bacterium]|nr:hypothetical protein [Cyclobacteriaceae bacterium HetDA_MAG_MS6]